VTVPPEAVDPYQVVDFSTSAVEDLREVADDVHVEVKDLVKLIVSGIAAIYEGLRPPSDETGTETEGPQVTVEWQDMIALNAIAKPRFQAVRIAGDASEPIVAITRRDPEPAAGKVVVTEVLKASDAPSYGLTNDLFKRFGPTQIIALRQ
jgi:hypothetical protein